MTGFKPWSSGIGGDRAINCATTTALLQSFYQEGEMLKIKRHNVPMNFIVFKHVFLSIFYSVMEVVPKASVWHYLKLEGK